MTTRSHPLIVAVFVVLAVLGAPAVTRAANIVYTPDNCVGIIASLPDVIGDVMIPNYVKGVALLSLLPQDMTSPPTPITLTFRQTGNVTSTFLRFLPTGKSLKSMDISVLVMGDNLKNNSPSALKIHFADLTVRSVDVDIPEDISPTVTVSLDWKAACFQRRTWDGKTWKLLPPTGNLNWTFDWSK